MTGGILMIGKFYDSFNQKKEEKQSLPQEVVEVLNTFLPDNFAYIRDDKGHYRAVPRPEKIMDGIQLTTRFDIDKNSDLFIKLSRLPMSKWDEYLYRTQTKVPVKSARIGNKDKQIPIEMLTQDPLIEEEILFVNGWIYPNTFPGPIKMVFESPEGERAEIGFQQQAFDSFSEVKFLNVDFPALRIELYQYSPLSDESVDEETHTSADNQVTVKYSVTPSKAGTVKEAVVALHLFRGLFNGTTKVNGQIISPKNGNGKFDPKQIEDALNLWETALILEDILSVKFDPSAEFPVEDVRFFAELTTCFIDKKAIVWRHPFDHFHVAGFHPVKNDLPFKDFTGSNSVRYEFLEGPIPATLLGAEFNLYSQTEMRDFVMTNIEWDDDSHEAAEIYISDVQDKQWTLARMYITETEAEQIRSNHDSKE